MFSGHREWNSCVVEQNEGMTRANPPLSRDHVSDARKIVVHLGHFVDPVECRPPRSLHRTSPVSSSSVITLAQSSVVQLCYFVGPVLCRQTLLFRWSSPVSSNSVISLAQSSGVQLCSVISLAQSTAFSKLPVSPGFCPVSIIVTYFRSWTVTRTLFNV